MNAPVRAMATPLAAVAWDVDGTLVDSEPLHLRALLAVCAAQGVSIADFGTTPFVGVSITEVWRRIGARFPGGPKQGEAAFYAAVSQAYLERVADLQPRAHAVAVVRALDAAGIAQCAVSNSNRATVMANLRQLGIAGAMACIVTLDDVSEPKPAAAPYRLACATLGLDTRRCLAVEDSASGLASARAAGLRTALYTVEPGWQNWIDLADHALASLAEVPALLGLALPAAAPAASLRP
ncbi:MAG: HAD family phosphatase [Burkholderiales bacterium]|nr:HAD family phosphatase [Burkholderiales bacterium]